VALNVASRKADPPADVPGYEILRVVASGGFSTIYKAWDEASQQAVALKVLNERGSHMAEFLDQHPDAVWEGPLATSFNHPNIIKVFNYGRHGGNYFLAMEMVNCIKTHLLRPARTEEEVGDRVRILVQAADAVDHMHNRGFIHRDLCSGNVLIDRNLTTKLIDFGLTVSKSLSDLYVGKAGTPSYMAPELIRTDKTTVQTDVYSFGVVMYELLTGKKPFKADSKFSRMVRSLNVNPAPLSRFTPVATEDLEQVVARALEKEPRDRFKSMAEVRNSLLALTRAFAASK